MVPDAELISIKTMLAKTQQHWVGHVVGMDKERLPKRLLYGELLKVKRSVGGQPKRYRLQGYTKGIAQQLRH